MVGIRSRFLSAVLLLSALGGPVAAETFITVASTTSTRNSGLYDWILPKFEKASGISVRVIAVGTGQAIRVARQGDADALLVHDRASEMKFVADGFGIDRRELMYNHFVIVGPAQDPAGVRAAPGIAGALGAIERTKALFVSRGDDSGTHKMERRLWAKAKIDPAAASGKWYREAGAGMGATLNMAAAMNAYTLVDGATWLAFRNRRGLEIAVGKSPELRNQYSVILVNPAKHPHVKTKAARAFADWLTSAKGQAAIAAYRIDGTQLFFPNAGGAPGKR